MKRATKHDLVRPAIAPGARVQFTKAETAFRDCIWVSDVATGTVQRVFKNGLVSIALEGTFNRSRDGKVSIYVEARALRVVAI